MCGHDDTHAASAKEPIDAVFACENVSLSHAFGE
jgi:hypothetical protein